MMISLFCGATHDWGNHKGLHSHHCLRAPFKAAAACAEFQSGSAAGDLTCRKTNIDICWILYLHTVLTAVHTWPTSRLPCTGQAGATFESVGRAEACATVFPSSCPSFPPAPPRPLIFHTGAEDSWTSAPLPPLAPWQLHCKVHTPDCISIPLLPRPLYSTKVSVELQPQY